MRKIERSGQFRRDYKREARGQHRTSLDADLPLCRSVWSTGMQCGAPPCDWQQIGLRAESLAHFRQVGMECGQAKVHGYGGCRGPVDGGGMRVRTTSS